MQRSVKIGAIFLPTTLLILYVYMYSPHGAFGASDPLRANSSSSHVLDVGAGEEVAHVRDLYGNGGGSVPGSPATAMRCHRCALVTSSGHVSGSGAGEEIDRTECVIRMNDAPTAGYERDVGTRTTLRVVGHSSERLVARNSAELLEDECPGAGGHVIMVFWGLPDRIEDGWIQSFCGGERSNCFRISQDTERSKFDVLYRKETGLDRVGSETWLSTGFFTMVIATESCDHVKVYGGVPPDHCETTRGAQRTPYHYYHPRGPEECGFYLRHQAGMRGGSHRFITEKQVFGRWAKLYNITFTHPTW